MNLITPISPTEKLLARGKYHYYKNGAPAGVREPWQIHQQTNSEIIIRVERDANAFGTQILVESRGPENEVQSFQLQWRGRGNKIVHKAYAQYKRVSEGVKVTRSIEDSPTKETRFPCPADTIIAPLMRIYIGQVIGALMARQKPGQVLVPNITDPGNKTRLLEPVLSERQASLIKVELIEIKDQSYKTLCFEYTGGPYQPGSRFWLDEHGILLKYRWQMNPQTRWETLLNNYTYYR